MTSKDRPAPSQAPHDFEIALGLAPRSARMDDLPRFERALYKTSGQTGA